MDASNGHDPVAPGCSPTNREAISVLIIDDEAHVRTFLRKTLQVLGLNRIHEAGNGEEGVAAYAELRPSLVLLDIHMPVMSGEAALVRILELDPEAVVIMITSETWQDTVLRFHELGACGYVLKHGRPSVVRAALAELIDSFEVVPAG